MYQTITQSSFIDAFNRYDRGEQFSYHSLCALFEYLNDEEFDDYELDVIGVCCEFAEFNDAEELQEAYGDDDTEEFDWSEWIDYLSDKTTVLTHEGGLTLVSF